MKLTQEQIEQMEKWCDDLELDLYMALKIIAKGVFIKTKLGNVEFHRPEFEDIRCSWASYTRVTGRWWIRFLHLPGTTLLEESNYYFNDYGKTWVFEEDRDKLPSTFR